MAIYRPPKPRWPLAVAATIAGLAIGLLIGLLIGSKDPQITDSVTEIRTQLVSAAGGLEIAAIEYRESVEDGRIVRLAEYDGALAALKSSRAKYEDVRPALDSLLPSHVSAIDALYDQVEDLLRDRAPAERVDESLGQLEQLLKG